MHADDRLSAIIDDLYAGALDDAAWHRGILGIALLVRGASAVIFGVNPLTESTFRAESHDFDPELLNEFCTRWFDREIRLQPALLRPIGEPIFDAKLMPMRTWQQSEIYNEFLYKIDKPWFLCFWLHKTSHKYSILAIYGSRQRGPMD